METNSQSNGSQQNSSSSLFSHDSTQLTESTHPRSQASHSQQPIPLPTNILTELPSGDLQIWGTNIKIQEVSAMCKDFILGFNKDGLVFYKSSLEEILLRGTSTLEINLEHVYAFNNLLYYQIISYPHEMFKVIGDVLNTICLQIKEERASWPLPDSFNIQCSLYNAKVGLKKATPGLEEEITITLRDLNPSFIDTLVTIKGLVIRCSGLVPNLQIALYKCEKCNKTISVPVVRDNIMEPSECPNDYCRERNAFKLLHKSSIYGNQQVIKIQETNESIPKGETPLYIDIIVYDDLYDKVKPGDSIEVTGIYRIKGIRRTQRQREIYSTYSYFVDASNFKVLNDTGRTELETKNNESILENRKINHFKELSKRDDIYELLVRSLAPSIFGMENVKLGILTLLFGGSAFSYEDKKIRNEINVLLCGDPGTSKSQLLQQVHKLSPRGIYTSGKGTSAVGLTAYVYKNKETSDYVLESGALVLSDSGVCCIDEFDKMDEGARSIMHEVMEQQTVSLAKAGIICTLNARTSVLAAANPKESRYNPKMSIIKNLRLPPSLISRFDLIFLVLDKSDDKKDAGLAGHMLSLYTEESNQNVEYDNVMEKQELKEYIKFARDNYNPKPNKEAVELIKLSYLELRSLGNTQNRNVISSTIRQLESLIRISESLAKMRLDNVITTNDVTKALELLKASTHAAATDPKTGLVDMELLITGKSAEERRNFEERIDVIVRLIDDLKDEGITEMKITKFKTQLKDRMNLEMQSFQFNDLIKHLETEEILKITSEQSHQPSLHFL